MREESYRVFVSSVNEGYQEIREAVERAVVDLTQEDLALSVLRSEDFPASDPSPQKVCLEAAQHCDIYLGIFGSRYSSPTAEEYAEARRHSKPCLIFVEDVPFREPAQEEFLARLDNWNEGHVRCIFRAPDDLKYQVAKALRSQLLPTRYLKDQVKILADLPPAPMEKRRIATGDLVRLDLLAQTDEKDKPTGRRCGLDEAMRGHLRLLILGPGGAGKSATLRRVAFDHSCRLLQAPVSDASGTSEVPVPVLLRLIEYDGDLIGKVAKLLSTSSGQVEASLAQKRILLLLDGFDELKLMRRFVDDLQQLVCRIPTARCVLTSRPHPALATLSLSIATPFSLAPLEEDELASLLGIHLGADDADRLLHSLKDHGLVEFFRLPLMAWFATLAFRNSGSEPPPVAKGALYQRVLDGFLREWERSRRQDWRASRVDLKTDCLASLGQEMVRRNVTRLDLNQALSVCRAVLASSGFSAVTPDELLEELAAHSLLDRSRSGVEFWHLDLRNHFAAVWLAGHASPWKVALLARHAHWQESVIHLASMLDERRFRNLLRLLLLVVPVATLDCSFRPVGWAADWIFLVLRCLTESQYPCGDLRDRLLDQIRGRNLFLGRTRAPIRFQRRGWPNPHLELHALIGQLGTKASFDYLRQLPEPHYKVVGLGQFRNMEAV